MNNDDDPQGFCRRLASVASALEVGDTLRFLARRRAPLARSPETLGHLEVLLRFSCYGQGRGLGILVFNWPTCASGHSVVTVLERWKDLCAERETYVNGDFSVEWRSVPPDAVGSTPGIHLKIRFPVCHVPPMAHELMELASRVGIISAANAALRRESDQPDREEKTPGEESRRAAELPVQKNGADLVRIDRIESNVEFDAAVHPRVSVNEQVRNSRGEIYRLVVKRVHGNFRQVWIRIPAGFLRTIDEPTSG
jgi:hypothetical protein